jgi:uncharacterized caspase-like protein
MTIFWCAAALGGLLCRDAVAQSSQQRGFAQHSAADDAALANGNYYALVIGIDRYAPPMPTLSTAVNDAISMSSVLKDRFGFQVTLLTDRDATRSSILNTLNRYRNTLDENDNLLIYYAGHGYSDPDADRAYWLPVDAESVESANRISADDLTAAVRTLRSRHVLIISDSCYSGSLTRDPDLPSPSGGQTTFLSRMVRSRSRTLMASGGDEPVSDTGTGGHSVFAYAVLSALEQTDEPVFTAGDLFYSSVRQQVAGRSRQIPKYDIIRNSNHDNGDFVFVLKAAVAAAPVEIQPPSAPETSRASTPAEAPATMAAAPTVETASRPPDALDSLLAEANATETVPQHARAITGKLTDMTGATIPGARVVGISGGRYYQTVSDDTGHFRLNVDRSDDVLKVVIYAPGFKLLAYEPVGKGISRLDSKMDIGSSSVMITIRPKSQGFLGGGYPGGATH